MTNQPPHPPLKLNKLWSSLGALGLLLILIASLAPQPEGVAPIPNLDKALHFLVYAVASFYFGQVLQNKVPFKSGVGILAFSALMELLQWQTESRSAEWLDLAANLAGISAGTYLSRLLGTTLIRAVDDIVFSLWRKIKI